MLVIEAALQQANVALPGVTVVGGMPVMPGAEGVIMPKQLVAPTDGDPGGETP
jgi:hypothetical protein